jgi:hypothetical protein
MATICALLVDVFQYLFEVNFIQGLLQRSEQNSFLLHMDDVIEVAAGMLKCLAIEKVKSSLLSNNMFYQWVLVVNVQVQIHV